MKRQGSRSNQKRIWPLIGGTVCLILVSIPFLRARGVTRGQIGHFMLLLLHNFSLWGLLLLCSFGLGSKLMGWLGLHRKETGEFLLFATVGGLGTLSIMIFLAGALGLLYNWMAWILMGVGVILCLVEVLHYRVFYREIVTRMMTRLLRQQSLWERILFILLVLNLLYPLIGYALVPPISWDEVAYHLAIPKIYIQNHRIVYIPFIPYSNWPLGAEMLFTLGLLLGSEILAHLVGWSALLLACSGLWLFGNRYLGRTQGQLAAVFFAATPMVGALAGTALVELPLALFTFLAVFAFIKWIEKKERRWWLLSSVFGGFAASTKLNGALVPLILGLLIAVETFCSHHQRVLNSLKLLGTYGLVSFVVVSPWYLKSFVYTSNPFWPFFIGVLGGKNWDALGNEYLFGFIKLVNMPLTIPNWLLGLWHLTTQSDVFGPYRVAIGWYYLILLPLAIPALIFSRGSSRRVLLWLLIIGVAFYTAWFFQTHQARFLLFATPVLSLLMASGIGGIGWLCRMRWRPGKAVVQTVVAICLLVTSWVFSEKDRNLVRTRWPFLAGIQTREDFLLAHVPGYATFHYANKYLPQDSYVFLALYESRGYYLDRDYMWANPISQRYLRLEQFPDADALYKRLKAMGFTHILFAPGKLDRYMYIRYGSHYTQLILDLIQDHACRLYETPDLILYTME